MVSTELSVALPSTSNVLLAIVLPLVLAYCATKIIYNLYYSPLHVIPGPWYAAISNAWIVYHVLRLEQCKTVHQLFEAYGPIVRIGPNKVVFRDVQSTRLVYSHHKFDKSTYYKSLLTNDDDHAMTTLEHTSHAIRRKAYASHYIPTNLALFQPEIHEATLELIENLNRIAGKSPLECLALFRHLLVDIVSSLSYGHRVGAVRHWSMNVENTLSTAINDFPKRGILRSAVPTWAWKLVCRIPNKRWRQLCDSDKVMAEFVGGRVYDMRAQIKMGKVTEDAEKKPLLQRLLQHQYPSGPMPESHIISELMGHLIAGADTSSTSLSYFLWELSRRSDVAKKLQQEIDDIMPDARAIPDINALNKLPYLNAVIKEGLRIYGSAPSLLERVVPQTEDTTKADFDLLGYALPPGTIIATQAWSQHRDVTVFPSPDTFLPERWLTDDHNLTIMNHHMMAFGVGSRICGGQNLAQMTLRIMLATLVRNFDFVAPKETNEKTMEMKDTFVIFPASMECKLFFVPRSTL